MVESSQAETNADAIVTTTRILVVDQASPDLEATVQHLRKAGYRCDTAPDADQARELLLARSYDLLVTDINLADGEGARLIEHVQQTFPGLPVMVVTESPSLESAIRSVELPVVAYLLKSESKAILCERVRATIARTGASRLLLRTQRRLRQCAADLDDVCNGTWRPGPTEGQGQMRVPISTLQALAGCLSELVALETGPNLTAQVTRFCKLLHCPVWQVQRNAIHKCILLLHETKRRFKSKELAQVREILEELLKTLQ